MTEKAFWAEMIRRLPESKSDGEHHLSNTSVMLFFHRFHQQSHPDFPATEPDDCVNGMVTRVVHIAEVNPEKSALLGSDAERIKSCIP